MKYYHGQSLIEVLIAGGVLVSTITALTFLVVDAYSSHRIAQEKTRATFLAQEGLEATRSIRDNNWTDLTLGEHGILISDNHWVFSGLEEDIGNKLKNGKRKIIVEEIDPDRRRVTSKVNWQFSSLRPQEVKLFTYLTNWSKVTIETCVSYCQSIGYSNGICRRSAQWCNRYGETHEPGGDEYCTGGPLEDTCCCAP